MMHKFSNGKVQSQQCWISLNKCYDAGAPQNQLVHMWSRDITATQKRRKPHPVVLSPTSRSGHQRYFSAPILDWHRAESSDVFTRSSGFTGIPANTVVDPLISGFVSGTSPTLRVNELNLLAMKVRLKISQQKLDVTTSLAESGKTLRYVDQRLRSLAKGLVALKRGRFGDFRDAVTSPAGPRPQWVGKSRRNLSKVKPIPPDGSFSGSLASRWLEYNYAFKPIVYDIEDAIDALNSNIPWIPNPVIKAKARVTIPINGTKSLRFNLNGHQSKQEWVSGGKWTAVEEVFYTLNMAGLLEAQKFGITTVGSTLWELQPWSFLVDWAIPVGSWLESLQATLNANFVSGSRTIAVVAHADCVGAIGDGPYPFSVLKRTGGTYSIKCFTRSPRYHFPIGFVPVKNPFSLSHAVTSAALLRSILF